ncbi:MAG: WYL domain-containing protein [Clostridia bacterium]|nr:WYL domain-containing protein [Clostridia bacterium]
MDNDSKLRPLYLAKILYEQTDEEHYLTTVQLINILEEKYGISAHRQTIKSEIELLRKFGIEIEEVKSVQNRYNICSRDFENSELKLLIDAVESAKFITAGKSKELVAKLSSLAGNFGAEKLKRNVCCEGRIKSDNERIYIIVDTINEAINEGKKISFPYFQYNVKKQHQLKHNGEAYVLSPLHLVWNGDFYYLVGVAEDNTIRNFRVDRIAKCPTILEENSSQAPEDFNIDDYINTTFRMFNAEHTDVELLCDNDVIDSIIDRFGENIKITEAATENFKITVNVATSHIFYSWIFGFGGKVKILGPDAVREEYVAMLDKARESASAN